MYREINENITIGDLIKSGAYGEFADYIFTDMTEDHFYNALKNYGYEAVGFEKALHRMEDLAQTGRSYVYQVYDEETCLANYDKARVKLLHFPGPRANAPYALVIPGGGLNRQWGLIEGQAIAARLNELGYTAFVLYYRVKQEPVMAKAVEDMYAAIKFIEANAAKFEVEPGNYFIGGFSAGAIIAQEIGSKNLGYHVYDVPRPKMIFLGYTAIKYKEMYEIWDSLEDGSAAKNGMAVFLKKMGGPDFTLEDLLPYNLADHIDGSYPPCYIVANMDDTTVDPTNSVALDGLLSELGVEHITKIGQTGGHSFGLGIGLEVGGWLDEAVALFEAQLS